MKRDIFEDMRVKVGCMYISDLSSLEKQVEKELLNFSLEQYSKEQIYEFCEYVFGKNNSIYKSLKDKSNK